VLRGQQVACDFDADNPGQWMTHCDNLYYTPRGGMMALLVYRTDRRPGRVRAARHRLGLGPGALTGNPHASGCVQYGGGPPCPLRSRA
jgi:hypothetical protein